MSNEQVVAALLVSLAQKQNSIVGKEARKTNNAQAEDKPSSNVRSNYAELSADAKPSCPATSSDSPKPKRKYKKRVKDPVHVFEVEPRVIQSINKAKTIVDHSYRDFSVIPKHPDYAAKVNIEDMSFVEKIHSILENDKFSLAITWLPHGRAFKVVTPKMLETQVLSVFFGHGRYSSFLSDLKQHGFKLLTTGPDRNSYYHESFLRNRSDLCKYIPPPRNRRRLKDDPENEPDFYVISKIYPVDETARGSVPQDVVQPEGAVPAAIPGQARPVPVGTTFGSPLTPANVAWLLGQLPH